MGHDYTLPTYRAKDPILNEWIKASITVLKEALRFIILQQLLGTTDQEVLQTVRNAYNNLFLVIITLLTNINTSGGFANKDTLKIYFSCISQIDRGNYMVTQSLRNKISLWVWKNILQVNAANKWNVFCQWKAHNIIIYNNNTHVTCYLHMWRWR